MYVMCGIYKYVMSTKVCLDKTGQTIGKSRSCKVTETAHYGGSSSYFSCCSSYCTSTSKGRCTQHHRRRTIHAWWSCFLRPVPSHAVPCHTKAHIPYRCYTPTSPCSLPHHSAPSIMQPQQPMGCAQHAPGPCVQTASVWYRAHATFLWRCWPGDSHTTPKPRSFPTWKRRVMHTDT